MDWKSRARLLRIGEKEKVKHCSNDNSALISNNAWGISYHCFRCGPVASEKHGDRSIAELVATRRAEEVLRKEASMPSRAVPMPEAPYMALRWILSASITPEDATSKWGMRWDDKTHRVLIPTASGILARAVHGEHPKYRQFGDDAIYSIGSGPVCVVVEDILSAIAVSGAGFCAHAVLGTSITGSVAGVIAESTRVIGWFDNDAAGDKAWKQLRKRLALYPVTVRRISTMRDPKWVWRSKIKELVMGKTND